MTPENRADAALHVTASLSTDTEQVYEELCAALRKHLVVGITDSNKCVDRVDCGSDAGGRRRYSAYAGSVLRLIAALKLTRTGMAIKLKLIATHGSTVASEEFINSPELLGDADRGNDLLVARLLHVAIFSLVSAGIEGIRVTPAHPNLRAHFEAMGFEKGQLLNMTNRDALVKAFEYIELTYEDYDIDIPAPPPL